MPNKFDVKTLSMWGADEDDICEAFDEVAEDGVTYLLLGEDDDPEIVMMPWERYAHLMGATDVSVE